jgi:hypothetical protein
MKVYICIDLDIVVAVFDNLEKARKFVNDNHDEYSADYDIEEWKVD